ncbi:hypothetical protein F5Y18DRAFT_367721 [Xylariaceae sp. FL1019]|nr:hypothetical protein F5Y18DRAFT_367721 [Xylariaceae sp. FL1019]
MIPVAIFCTLFVLRADSSNRARGSRPRWSQDTNRPDTFPRYSQRPRRRRAWKADITPSTPAHLPYFHSQPRGE